ncbi:MAG: pentapeptide repeat-containing protein [Cyanobacteria bacterium P01_A01_bin.80]
MTDSSRGRKKNKLTITASEQGIEKAKKALIRFGFESKSNFAKSQLISRTTVTKFFQCEQIQLDSFKKICEGLTLNWREIAGIPSEKEQAKPSPSSENDKFISGICEGEGNKVLITSAPVRTKVDVIDEKQTVIAEIILQGDSVNNLGFIQSILQEYSGNTIRIIDIKPGSIKLFIEGSQEDIQKLQEQIESGKLKEVDGLPVKDIKILGESFLDNESNVEKWSLVREIRRQGAKGLNLIGVDLSDADLSGVDFRGADLNDADLSGADLSDADLSDADLSGADLSDADLSDADLSGADLSGADLNDAILSYGTNLIGATVSSPVLSFIEDALPPYLTLVTNRRLVISSFDLDFLVKIFLVFINADIHDAINKSIHLNHFKLSITHRSSRLRWRLRLCGLMIDFLIWEATWAVGYRRRADSRHATDGNESGGNENVTFFRVKTLGNESNVRWSDEKK